MCSIESVQTDLESLSLAALDTTQHSVPDSVPTPLAALDSSLTSFATLSPYTPFEQIKVTTYTLVLTLDSPINISTAFWFLKLTPFPISKELRVKSIDTRNKITVHKTKNGVDTTEFKKQKKLPLPTLQHGQIVSARYETLGRGSIKIYDSFKNVITVDITVGNNSPDGHDNPDATTATTQPVKNLNIKLCKEKIQITGAKSVEQGLQATELLLQHLREAQQLPVDYRLKHFAETLQEVLQSMFPEQLEYTDLSMFPPDNDHVDPNSYDPVHDTLTESEQSEIYSVMNRLAPYLNQTLLNWLQIETIENIRHFSTALLALANSLQQELFHIMSLNNHVKFTDIVMANCNYNLGFKINRVNFSKTLHGVHNMITHYDNMSQRSVKIERFYTRNNSNIRPKAKKPHHTLTVYMSGIVTQSGPGGEQMKEMYNTFRQAVHDLREDIIKE